MFPFPAPLLCTGASLPAGLQFVGATSDTFNGFGTGTHTVSLSGTLTGGLGSSPAAGDIVLIAYGANGSTNQTLGVSTSGYTEVANLYANDSLDMNLGAYYKMMSGTPDTQVDLLPNGDAGSGSSCAAVIHVWRGVNTGTPMDVAVTTATGANAGSPNPPAITPVTAGAKIIVFAGATGLNGGVALSQTGSELSNFRSVYSDHGDTSNNDCTVAMGSAAWTSGAFDPVALVGQANAADSWCAVTMALRPA